MARYAIGDVQGCHAELLALLRRVRFSADRDQLWFVGDLVNRGPESLEVLRLVRSLGDNAIVVLGNHDLHLLAVAYGRHDRLKAGDTLNAVLAATDRDLLLEWLLSRPLVHHDAVHGDLMVHAGLVPQWTPGTAEKLAREVEAAIRQDPRDFFDHMYGNKPDRWEEDLEGMDRRRVAINAMTRLRACRADGTMDLKAKGPPGELEAPWMPWYAVPERRSRKVRVIFGHWSTLGYLDEQGVLGLDTGCVWGGALTAVDLDRPGSRWAIPSEGYRAPGGD